MGKINIGRMKRRVSQAGGPNLGDGEGEGFSGHWRRAMIADMRSEFTSSFVLKVRVLIAAPWRIDRMLGEVAKTLQTDRESRLLISWQRFSGG